MITLNPVAYFRSTAKEKADVPRQGTLSEKRGFLDFVSRKNYEQALEDLEGMERIWVIFWMHDVEGWKTKVQPPRAVKKKGVFATRSPHRPNPLGLSCVKLISIKGLTLCIEEHDLLDGTPILDIKPYLPYADSFPNAQSGWIEEEESMTYEVAFSSLAEKELSYIGGELREKLHARLQFLTETSSSNRLKHIEGNFYVLAYKEWRAFFRKEEKTILVVFIFSGYKEGAPVFHREFTEKFLSENRENSLSFPFSF
jgi:tRNA (adenine37-N6)-methyltransferase